MLGGAGWRRLAFGSCLAALVACSGEIDQGDPFRSGTGGVGAGGSTGDGGSGGGGASAGAGGVGGGSGGALGGGGGGGDPIDPPPGSIPMFVAQGHAGRTIVSCDDGRSWVADQSEEDWQYCRGRDCDHTSNAARGITWGDGWFFATFGWGTPGDVRRSRDGVAWESVLGGANFGGIVFGNGRLVAADASGKYSDDQGDSWQDFDSVDLSVWTVRDAAFVPYGGGRFIMAASDGGSELVVSSDGSTWLQPESSAGCGGGLPYQGHIVYGDGVIIMTGEGGDVCRSTDGGQNWTSQSIAGSLRANGIWNGSEFMAWSYGTLYRSSDGQSWTTTPTVPGDVDFGVTAVSDAGTIVAVSNDWEQDYENQVFYRSEDGVNWDVLPGSAFTGGHQIQVIAFGYGQPSEHCSL